MDLTTRRGFNVRAPQIKTGGCAIYPAPRSIALSCCVWRLSMDYSQKPARQRAEPVPAAINGELGPRPFTRIRLSLSYLIAKFL
jgi:hypothetical protein